MPKDARTYITLHDGMPGNKKIRPLSDRAFRTIIELWCWCSEEGNDGHIDGDSFATFGSPRARTELLAKGLIEAVGDDFFAHDYLEHQRSQAEIAEWRAKKVAAGAKGGKASAVAKASAQAGAKQVLKQNASEIKPESESDDINQDTHNRPHVSTREFQDDSVIDPVLKSIVTAVRACLGIELHPIVAPTLRDFLDARRGPNAEPMRFPSKYYADSIARSSHEVAQFIHESGLAS